MYDGSLLPPGSGDIDDWPESMFTVTVEDVIDVLRWGRVHAHQLLDPAPLDLD